jgi:hypothetical protein
MPFLRKASLKKNKLPAAAQGVEAAEAGGCGGKGGDRVMENEILRNTRTLTGAAVLVQLY